MLKIILRTLESRGILALSPKESWLPTTADTFRSPMDNEWLTPFIVREIADLYHGPNNQYVWPERLTNITTPTDTLPDPTIASIFSTSLEITNDSAATALSTIFTILASTSYYDQFPNFAETTYNVSTNFFELFLFPQSFRGFAAVAIITIIHCLLVLFITITFITSTKLTTLGDHWQSVSQIVSPATESFFGKSGYITDKEVRAYMKAEGREQETVRIQPLANSDRRVGLVTRQVYRRNRHSHRG
jgi:hypothetical protein